MKSTPDLPTDPLGSIGAPIRGTKPAPAPTPVAAGIVRHADGTLATTAPPPAPIWTAPIVHIDNEPECDLRPVYISNLSDEELAGLADFERAVAAMGIGPGC